VTTRVIPAFHRFLQWTDSKPYSLQEAQAEFRQTLLTWIKDASPTGPFFFGEEMTMADIQMAPWAIRLWIFEHFKSVPAVPAEGEDQENEESWKRWRKWVNAVENRESVTNTLSEREYYLPLYERYHQDIAQSELAKATRSGRGVP
jgi:glutathione S-transferase